MTTTKPILKENDLYIGDNGQCVCVHCAGNSALYTGFDISGQKMHRVTPLDNADYVKLTADLPIEFHEKVMKCDCGKTTFTRLR